VQHIADASSVALHGQAASHVMQEGCVVGQTNLQGGRMPPSIGTIGADDVYSVSGMRSSPSARTRDQPAQDTVGRAQSSGSKPPTSSTPTVTAEVRGGALSGGNAHIGALRTSIQVTRPLGEDLTVSAQLFSVQYDGVRAGVPVSGHNGGFQVGAVRLFPLGEHGASASAGLTFRAQRNSVDGGGPESTQFVVGVPITAKLQVVETDDVALSGRVDVQPSVSVVWTDGAPTSTVQGRLTVGVGAELRINTDRDRDKELVFTGSLSVENRWDLRNGDLVGIIPTGTIQMTYKLNDHFSLFGGASYTLSTDKPAPSNEVAGPNSSEGPTWFGGIIFTH
jgi:hypothetical protein